MYAAIVCPKCGRNRIIDLDKVTSTCPYCSARSETKSMKILYKAETPNAVKDRLNEVSGIKKEERKKGPDTDPMSTLEYHYGKAKGLDKLIVLAEGLTKIKGTFTIEDVELFEPEKAEKIVEKMLIELMVIEARPGNYRTP